MPTLTQTINGNLDQGTLHSTFNEDVGHVTSLIFTDGDRLLASPSETWDFLTWDHTAGIQHHTFAKRLSIYGRKKLSPNGLLLASHNFNTNIDLWNLAAHNLQHTLVGHDKFILSTSFSTDSRFLASGGNEGAIILWETATGVQRARIMTDIGPVDGIAFSPGQQLLASIHDKDLEPKEIAVWNLNGCSPTQIWRYQDVSSDTRDILFSGDNKTLFSAGGSITLWDATDASQTRQPHDSWVRSVVFSLDGQLLATLCDTDGIFIWNITSESIIQNIGDKYNDKILAFSPSNTLLAFISSPNIIELWDINAKMQRSSIDAFGEVYCAALSSDDQLVACLVEDQGIKIWDLITGTLRNTINDPVHCLSIHAIQFSPGGEYLHVSSAESQVHEPDQWLIQGFRLPNTDTSDFAFWVSGAKVYFSRYDIETYYDFPVFKFGTTQGGLDIDMVNKSDDALKDDMQNQLEIHGEWLCYQGEKVLWLHNAQNQLAIDGVWLCYQGQKVLWLPESHQPRCWASNSKTLAIGHDSGGVTIIKISPQFGGGEFHNV